MVTPVASAAAEVILAAVAVAVTWVVAAALTLVAAAAAAVAAAVVAAAASARAGSDMGAEENQRLQAALAGFRHAPEMMAFKADPGSIIIAWDPDPAKGKTWKHTTDDKKATVPTPWGPMEAKVKWDGQTLHRELVMNSAGGFKVVEEYKLSADGNQLIETLKTTSVMSPTPKIQQVDIKRVYDRQQ